MPLCPPGGCICAVSCIYHRYVVLNIYVSLVGLGMLCSHYDISCSNHFGNI